MWILEVCEGVYFEALQQGDQHLGTPDRQAAMRFGSRESAQAYALRVGLTAGATPVRL